VVADINQYTGAHLPKRQAEDIARHSVILPILAPPVFGYLLTAKEVSNFPKEPHPFPLLITFPCLKTFL
jgi:hypothetical protein